MGRSSIIRRLKTKAKTTEEIVAPVEEKKTEETKYYYMRDDYCVCDICAKGRHREFFQEGALAFRPIPTTTYLPKFPLRSYQADGIRLAFDQEIHRKNSSLTVEWQELRTAEGVTAVLSVAGSYTWPNVIATFQHQSIPHPTYVEAQTQLMATYIKYHGGCVQRYRTDAAAQTFDYDAAYSSTPRTEEELSKGKTIFLETQRRFELGHITKPDKHKIMLNEIPTLVVKAPKEKLSAVQKIRIAKGLVKPVEEEEKFTIQTLEDMVQEVETERKAEHDTESLLTVHQRKFVEPKEDLYHFQNFEDWVDVLPLKGEKFYVYPELGVQLNPKKKIKKIKEPNTIHWHFSRNLDNVRMEYRKIIAENSIKLNPFFTPNSLAKDGVTKRAAGFIRLVRNPNALYEFVKSRHPTEISNHFHPTDAAPIISVMDTRLTALVDLEQNFLWEQIHRTCKDIWCATEAVFGRTKEAPFPLPVIKEVEVEGF